MVIIWIWISCLAKAPQLWVNYTFYIICCLCILLYIYWRQYTVSAVIIKLVQKTADLFARMAEGVFCLSSLCLIILHTHILKHKNTLVHFGFFIQKSLRDHHILLICATLDFAAISWLPHVSRKKMLLCGSNPMADPALGPAIQLTPMTVGLTNPINKATPILCPCQNFNGVLV